MKVLVTGAAGFLGLHIARIFSKKGAKLVLLDVAEFDRAEYPKDAVFVEADVRDLEAVSSVMEGIDVVIHAAAALPLRSADEIMDVNVMGTKQMLKAARTYHVKRFIYISSTAVYGVPKKHPVFEYDDLVGVGAYGASKIAAEEECRRQRRKGMIITIIRPKTFVGTHRLGVFEILFDWVKDGKKIPVIGTGDNKYQLLDVDDLVEALYLAATLPDPKKLDTEFNIGAERFNTVKEDMQALFKVAKSGSQVRPTPAGPVKLALFILEKLKLSPLYQWVYDTADKDSFVSIDKLTSTFKWHPRYSNGDALIKAYNWYVRHYDEIKSRPAGTTHTVGWKQGALGWVKKFM